MSSSSHNESERDPNERWWENTIHHAQGPDLPADSFRDRFIDAFAEMLRSEPGNAVVEVAREACVLHAMRIAQCLFRLPKPKAEIFFWKYLEHLSDREIGRRLGVDHKTVAAWSKDVAQALINPQWGGQNK